MKRLRAALDLTQERLAEEVGCAAHTIRTFESGTRRPSRALAERLVEKLQVPREQRVEFLRLARSPLTQSSAPAAGADPAGAGLDAPGGTPAATGTMLPTARASDASASAVTLEHAPLLATKLYLPRPRAQLVPRPRLLARLQAGLRGT
ncbi:MAG TPA: helix-turn-helix domain-containing protein, partial [Herpetosiphonaceae bacterium]|nr:helix-turn-helix domain-containing protein [Herpetosiphonaceae bacterium]